MNRLGTKNIWKISKADNYLSNLEQIHTQLLQEQDPDSLDLVKLIPVQVTVEFDVEQQQLVLRVNAETNSSN
jgi:hypothetical protein